MKYCCVPGCKNFNGHKFPIDPATRLKWRVAIRRTDPATKRLWTPNTDDVVCHAYFTSNDYKETLLGERKILKMGAVPSIFIFRTDITAESPRAKRKKKREETQDSTVISADSMDVQTETEISTTDSDSKDGVYLINEDISDVCDESIQCNIPISFKYSIEYFRNDSKVVNYYTGFKDYNAFMFFFQCLGPSVHELDFKCSLLEPKDQLFMTLMKLRQAKEDIELHVMFRVSESTVSRVILTWINFLYYQLKEINIWPSKDIIQEHMPSDFGCKFSNTRVILDATELPIQKPTDVQAQSITWSSYKHKNTLKTMIGCTPKGAVSYISKAYGGSASDRQIIEKSELLNPSAKMFDSGDSIMADRGIMVQDLFAEQDVFVNTPTMLRGKSQLEPQEVVRDRRVASKRIHVERIIGLSKGFKILQHRLPQSKLHLGSRIVFICFAISNFRGCVVDNTA